MSSPTVLSHMSRFQNGSKARYEHQMESKNESKPSAWRWWLGLLFVAFGAAEKIIGWGGSLDFLISRSRDPDWVGRVFNSIAANPGYLSFLLIMSGVALIVWNERRRTSQLLESRFAAAFGHTQTEALFSPEPMVERSVSPPDPAERIYLGSNITPVFLAELQDGKTSLEAQEATDKYVGKWMRVTGVLKNVSRIGNRKLWVTLAIPRKVQIAEGIEMDRDVEVKAEFERDFDRIRVRRPGDVFRVEGRIDRIIYMGLELEDCELLQSITQDELRAEAPALPPPPDTEAEKQP